MIIQNNKITESGTYDLTDTEDVIVVKETSDVKIRGNGNIIDGSRHKNPHINLLKSNGVHLDGGGREAVQVAHCKDLYI